MRSLVLAAALATAACVPELPAVSAAGSVAGRLDGQEATLITAGALCRDAAAISRNPSASCTEIESQAARWTKVANALAAYGRKLSELAGQKNPAVGAQVAVALDVANKSKWMPLSSDGIDVASRLAQLVSSLLTKTYRDVELADVIGGFNGPVQEACAALHGHIELQLENLDQLSKAAAQTQKLTGIVKLPPDGGTQEDVDRVLLESSSVSLQQLLFDLKARKAALERLDTAVVGFAAAHAKLYDHRDKFDSKELLAQVLDSVKSAASSN